MKVIVVPHTWDLYVNGWPGGKNIGTMTSLTTIDFDADYSLYFQKIGFLFLGKHLYEALGAAKM